MKSEGIHEDRFEDWLTRYGRAWSSQQPEAAAPLFTADAEYYWTPLEAPKRGRSQIVEAWRTAIDRQRDVQFQFRILSVSVALGIAHWHTTMKRRSTGEVIEVDGVLVAEFDDAGLCRCFREWWHSSGAASAGTNSAD